ncbi:NAD-dependent glycerol-3-phosphate dehydrogenase domain-containing protein [Perkinsela sp. CCAP 1560/4]|nr:NAD-dependent glycerol-3-phosphate dehydrogenase domain-containing protein [Perkinsela sp. CCAP 1560/4]|eukprot:KNH05553.1 NAD-dependent glycerol-3-phosphate dehydrogenase domain-containing protein [Perkinsela sp. CCAP 1560/4]
MNRRTSQLSVFSSLTIYLLARRRMRAIPADVSFPSVLEGYRKHVIVVGGGRVGIAVALALSRAARARASAENPIEKPFQVESLFTGSDSLNPAIRRLEEHNQHKRPSTNPPPAKHRLKITMLLRDPEIAASMQRTRDCAPYFPSLRLPADIEVSSSVERTFWLFHSINGTNQQSREGISKENTLYHEGEPRSGRPPRVPIVAVFLCVPYSALSAIFQSKGVLHSLRQNLPWHEVFAPSPAIVCFSRGIDERTKLPYEIVREELSPVDSKSSTPHRPIPFVLSQISGPFQPIELIDGKPVSALVTSGPCRRPADFQRAIEHEACISQLLSCDSPKHLVYIHQFHTHHASIHRFHCGKRALEKGCSEECCLRACALLAAMKEFYCLVHGLLLTTWSAQADGSQRSLGSCSSAAAALQAAFVNECGSILDINGLPAGSVYTLAGLGDVAAGCGASGGSVKGTCDTALSASLGDTVWKKLEAACRRHVCDWHPLYLMGTRIAQGFPGSYIFQLKGKASTFEKENATKFNPSTYQHTHTPNAYAQYVVEGIEALVGEAESRLSVESDGDQSAFPVIRACLKALKYDRRAKELGNIVLRPDRAEVKYSRIDMVNINNRDPDVYRHPMVDVIHILSENVVRPTPQTKANEEKLRLKMPIAPPAIKNLFP